MKVRSFEKNFWYFFVKQIQFPNMENACFLTDINCFWSVTIAKGWSRWYSWGIDFGWSRNLSFSRGKALIPTNQNQFFSFDNKLWNSSMVFKQFNGFTSSVPVPKLRNPCKGSFQSPRYRLCAIINFFPSCKSFWATVETKTNKTSKIKFPEKLFFDEKNSFCLSNYLGQSVSSSGGSDPLGILPWLPVSLSGVFVALDWLS